MPDAENDALDFIRSLVGAWDCCGTCAGGVLARRDRRIKAEAWDEGYDARGEDIANEGLVYTELTPNPYSVLPPGGSDA